MVRRLVDEDRPAGPQETLWDLRADSGRPISSGIYFCRLESGRRSQVRKLVLIG